MKKRNWILLIALIVALGIWGAGCGGDDSSDDNNTSGDTDVVDTVDNADNNTTDGDVTETTDGDVTETTDGDVTEITDGDVTETTDGDVTEITESTEESEGTETTEPALCPAGQTCIDVTGTGVLGCMENQQIPADNPRNCSQTSPCPANFSCFRTNNGTVCIENCGTCPEGLECSPIANTGYFGCMLNGQVPQDNQTGCGQNNPCQGNATCYCKNQECTDTICIENCSAAH